MSTFAAFGTQSNPQQNPGFQSQQSTMYAASQGQYPGWGQGDEEEEGVGAPKTPTASGTAAPRPRDPSGVTGTGASTGAIPAPEPTSPVSANGKLSMLPATPWGQPAPAPAYNSTFQQPLTAPARKNAPWTYTTGQAANANEQVLGAYQAAFGRSAAPAEAQHWAQAVSGGKTMTPEQLKQLQAILASSDEGKAYQGPRPTLLPGQFIPGATLGTTLQQDPAKVFETEAPSQFQPGPATPRPANTQYQGYDFGQFLSSQSAPQYQGSQFTQFNAPRQQALDEAGNKLVQQMVDSPDALNSDQINQIKAKQQELVNSRTKDAQNALNSDIASRGLSGSGGARMAGERRIAEAGTNELAGGFRDIDLKAAEMNDVSRRGTAETLSNYLTSQTGRATQGYGATLAGEGARAGDARAVTDSGYNNAQFDLQNKQFGFSQQQARAGDQRAVADSAAGNFEFDQGNGLSRDQLALQGYIGTRGLDNDTAKIDNQNDQFGRGLQFDFLKFMEDKYRGRADIDLRNRALGQDDKHFNSNLAFNYDNLSSDREMNFLNYLQRGQG
jgi:hypothetical protein